MKRFHLIRTASATFGHRLSIRWSVVYFCGFKIVTLFFFVALQLPKSIKPVSRSVKSSKCGRFSRAAVIGVHKNKSFPIGRKGRKGAKKYIQSVKNCAVERYCYNQQLIKKIAAEYKKWITSPENNNDTVSISRLYKPLSCLQNSVWERTSEVPHTLVSLLTRKFGGGKPTSYVRNKIPDAKCKWQNRTPQETGRLRAVKCSWSPYFHSSAQAASIFFVSRTN